MHTQLQAFRGRRPGEGGLQFREQLAQRNDALVDRDRPVVQAREIEEPVEQSPQRLECELQARGNVPDVLARFK